MPALFVWLFGGGGSLAAARARALGELGRTPRIAAALAVLVLALTPALMWRLAGPARARRRAFAATTAGRRSTPARCDRPSGAPEPGGARLLRRRAGQYALATRAMNAAGRATRATGSTPTARRSSMAWPDAIRGRRRARRRLNPLEPLARRWCAISTRKRARPAGEDHQAGRGTVREFCLLGAARGEARGRR
jgi:hypothetical protein